MQLAFINFTSRRFGEGRSYFNLVWNHILRQACSTKRLNCPPLKALSRTKDDKGFDLVPDLIIGNRDDGNFLNIGVAVEFSFNFA